jgi:hypothetical protein
MTRSRLIRSAVGLAAGGGAGFLINKWITCRGGG